MAERICGKCGKPGTYWEHLAGSSYTICPHCGGMNCQRPEGGGEKQGKICGDCVRWIPGQFGEGKGGCPVPGPLDGNPLRMPTDPACPAHDDGSLERAARGLIGEIIKNFNYYESDPMPNDVGLAIAAVEAALAGKGRP